MRLKIAVIYGIICLLNKAISCIFSMKGGVMLCGMKKSKKKCTKLQRTL